MANVSPIIYPAAVGNVNKVVELTNDEQECYLVYGYDQLQSGNTLVLGIDFAEPVFMHAITHIAPQYYNDWHKTDTTAWF